MRDSHTDTTITLQPSAKARIYLLRPRDSDEIFWFPDLSGESGWLNRTPTGKRQRARPKRKNRKPELALCTADNVDTFALETRS
jgi:hypothetical protein